MNRIMLVPILAFAALFLCKNCLANDCSEANIQSNLQTCLSSIWTKATDKSAFWFGTQWLSICGYNPFQAPYCSNLKQPYSPHSLMNTVYGLDHDLSQNPLKYFLHITYQTTTGTYMGCGNTYTVTETKTFNLEPLLTKIYSPWDTKPIPTITWTTTPNTLYTLIIYDAGAYISHGVFINIEGNDVSGSETIRPYNSPKNPSKREQPYVFMVFEQTGRINLTEEWRHKLEQSMVSEFYNFTDVFQDLQLNGPVAMNWVQVVRDSYSAQAFVTAGIMNVCPDIVSEALRSKNISFVPDDVDLSMSLDIEIHSTALSFESCCTSYRYPEHKAMLNPIGDGYISPGRSRTGSALNIKLLREGLLFMPAFGPQPLHTLICVDISVPSPTAGTPDLPILHMMATNINGSDLTTGDIIKSYRGPAPPDYKNHTYIFLLYSQKGGMAENETMSYQTSGCSGSLSGRCLFNVSRFVTGNDLTLIGASWFLAITDEYVRYSHITSGRDPATVCSNIQGYGDPCPVGGGHMFTSHILITLTIIIGASIF